MKHTTKITISGIVLCLFVIILYMCIVLFPIQDGDYSYLNKTNENQVQKTENKIYEYKPEPILIEPQISMQQEQIIEHEPEPEPEIEYYKSPINLTEDDRWFIECVVAGECAYEPYEGKLAVAQCYFNAMIKSGLSAREVQKVYGYVAWNDRLDKQNPKMYIEVMDAVHDIFDVGQFVTETPILFFYAPALCDSPWHESQNYAMTIGGHKFFYLTEDENAEWTNILLTNVNEYGIIEQ